jgi:DNA-binding NarL/FixJ family response regulator
LGGAEGTVVVATTESGLEAERLLAEFAADVIVMDTAPPSVDGHELAQRLLVSRPDAAVILLAARDDDAAILSALEAGCAGVIRRDRAFDDLGAAIVAAHDGEPVVAPGRMIGLLRQRRVRAEARLTRRETEVLMLMFEGLSNEMIAERLFVTLNTVRNHVQRILTKLSAHSKLEAVAEAGRRGLLRPT